EVAHRPAWAGQILAALGGLAQSRSLSRLYTDWLVPSVELSAPQRRIRACIGLVQPCSGDHTARLQRRTWTTATSSAYNRRQPGEWSKWSAAADPGRSRVHDTLYASASCSSLSSFPSAIASK